MKYTVASRRAWKSEELNGYKPTVYDWARLAAFIDGEGTVDMNTCSAAKPRYIVRVLIGNTNPILIQWLWRTFGGNMVLRKVKNPNAKDTYIWSCCSARAAWILHNCLPWFLLKGAQAELMMELQGNIDQTRQGRGRKVSDESMQHREELKLRLRGLNAKGRAAQVPVSIEEMRATELAGTLVHTKVMEE